MTRFVRIKLKNLSPLHVGVGRDSYEVASDVVPSDMLSAALASVRAIRGRSAGLADFLNSFALSSAFPYVADEFFLPAPKGRLSIGVKGLVEKDYRKKLKKLDFISLSLWKRLTKGEHIEVEPSQLNGSFLSEKKNSPFFFPYKSVPTQRVSVSRSGETDANPFLFEWTFFRPDAGLYCLLDADNENTINEVVSLFVALGEFGLGTDRTVGGGQFSVEQADSVELTDVTSDHQMLLSSYIPSSTELDSISLTDSVYQLIHRGGFVAGSSDEAFRASRKKTIYMFGTGSVLSSSAPLRGIVVNLAPNGVVPHPVYRSGRPLTIHIASHDE